MAYLSYNGSTNNGGGNHMILVLAMFLLIFIGMSFLAPKPPQESEKNETTNQLTDTTLQQAQNAPAITVQHKIETRTLEAGQISVEMTNAGGGRIQSVKINDPDRYGPYQKDDETFFDGNFIRSQKSPSESIGGILPLEVTLPSFGITPETQFAVASGSEDHKEIKFSYSDPTDKFILNKVFTTTDKPYVIHAKFDMTNLSPQVVSDVMGISFYIKQIKEEEPGIFTPGSYVAAKCYSKGDMEYVNATDKNESESYSTDLKWFGVDESYFAMAMTADKAKECKISNNEGTVQSMIQIPVVLESGQSTSYEFDIYLGPKESRYLDNFGEDRNLKAIIDYGWMEVLARPMAWILDKFHDLTGNWGIAIIILTIIVRILLWPIAQKSQFSMMRMSKLAPMMQELQEKYKDDPQTLAQKQMEMYQKYKISPFGCLPLLLQMPIFFALYRCIFVTGGLYHAEFFGWIHDLSARDPYFILPIFSVLLLVGQQLLTPSAAKNTQQKVMMIAMPIMFGGMMLFLPSGLCVYMVVSSVFSMVQSFYVRRKIAAEDAKNPILAGANGTGDVIDVENLSSKEKRAEKRRTDRDKK